VRLALGSARCIGSPVRSGLSQSKHHAIYDRAEWGQPLACRYHSFSFGVNRAARTPTVTAPVMIARELRSTLITPAMHAPPMMTNGIGLNDFKTVIPPRGTARWPFALKSPDTVVPGLGIILSSRQCGPRTRNAMPGDLLRLIRDLRN